MIGASTIDHPLFSTGDIVLQESSFGYRYPFCNGSWRVSNKGLGDPNSPSIIIIVSANKFCKGIAIISCHEDIRWIVLAGKILGNGLVPSDLATPNNPFFLLLLLLLVPFLHKHYLLGRG